MKRIVSFVIVLTMLFTLGTCVADEIMFRGIPWGSDADYTCDKLDKNGLSLYLSSLDEYASIAATYRIKNMLSPSMYGNATIEKGVTTYALSYPMDLKVAGYNVASVMTFFVYRPHEGELVYDHQYTAFYAGMYSFIPEDLEGMFNDLRGKLTSIYGEYVTEGGQEIVEDLFGEKTFAWSSFEQEQKIAVWETAESNLFLVSNKVPEDADPMFYSNSIVIVYAAKESDKWIDEALEAQKRTNERLEREKYGNGDTDGL